jgi:hypothetical protein
LYLDGFGGDRKENGFDGREKGSGKRIKVVGEESSQLNAVPLHLSRTTPFRSHAKEHATTLKKIPPS